MTTAEEVNQALLESLYTKSEITEKVEQLIEADTEATVQLLKSWLNDM
jgi:flagellar biosynthesis/type III secretory pathway M-ring protein FliF/YscJ